MSRQHAYYFLACANEYLFLGVFMYCGVCVYVCVVCIYIYVCMHICKIYRYISRGYMCVCVYIYYKYIGQGPQAFTMTYRCGLLFLQVDFYTYHNVW